MRELLADETAVLGLPTPVLFEFQVRLHEKGVLAQHPGAVVEYEGLFDITIPVDSTVANAAFQLKRDGPERLPALDALIAASAKVHDAVLLHRDPHIQSIPRHLLKQESLPAKT